MRERKRREGRRERERKEREVLNVYYSTLVPRLDAEAKGSKVLVTLTERGHEGERKKHR